jgi:ATP-dependent RNA helicase RhlE
LDHAGRPTVDLSKIEILVLDEADRMLDMGFLPDIKRIMKLLPARRQNLLFSATYTDDVKRFADGLLHSPEVIEVARRSTAAETVAQVVHPVGRTRKRALLSHLIKVGNWNRVLVFTRTKHGANRLTKQLTTDGISATAIHGNKSQAARTKALSDFKRGRVSTLVATDIAARGLDIDHLPHVVNFDMPAVAEDYIHRIGRTGRAGETGKAISLVSADERGLLTQVERLLRCKVEVELIEGFTQETPEELAKDRAAQGRATHPGRSGNIQGRRERPGAFTRRPSKKGRRGAAGAGRGNNRGGRGNG